MSDASRLEPRKLMVVEPKLLVAAPDAPEDADSGPLTGEERKMFDALRRKAAGGVVSEEDDEAPSPPEDPQ